MCVFKVKWLLNAKVSPLFWNRYVDDTFTMFHNKDSANEFLHYLNGCHRNIKFTIEFEHNNAIPFLDILVTRNQNNAFTTSIYRKKTFTGLYTKHRQPKLKMLGVQCNVTYAMLHNYAKRDSRLTTYGGIVLQRFEFVKVCMGRQRLCWKSQLFLYFVNKLYLPCCRAVFFVVCQLRRPI